MAVEEGDEIDSGEILVKILRSFGKSGDITGGLPRVTELFEARNPSDPAVVSEIDGVVSFEPKLKRGNRVVKLLHVTMMVLALRHISSQLLNKFWLRQMTL